MNQIVIRDDPRGPHVELLENDSSKSPLNFEDLAHGRHVPRLGSQDLLQIAQEAEDVGWDVERFEIVDTTDSSVDEERESEVSTVLSAALSEGGAAAALTALMSRFPTFSVAGVELVGGDNLAVTLRRGGVVVADRGYESTGLVRLLERHLFAT
jgi:hypothetical protein